MTPATKQGLIIGGSIIGILAVGHFGYQAGLRRGVELRRLNAPGPAGSTSDKGIVPVTASGAFVVVDLQPGDVTATVNKGGRVDIYPPDAASKILSFGPSASSPPSPSGPLTVSPVFASAPMQVSWQDAQGAGHMSTVNITAV